MGDPKYPSRVWKKPKRPLNYDFMMEDLNTLGNYGLKNKRELWKARTELSRVRHQARSLLALRQEIRAQKEPVLMKSLVKIGLVKEDATLDDVLNLDVNNLLDRRLQTIVLRKFSLKTPYQARQAIVHGHITIGDRIITVPSYIVTIKEESSIVLSPKFKVQASAPPPEPQTEEAVVEQS
ncbi:MAG TPA: 30S ribosomal protein S4 [Candidatus Nitrosotenuis sp.]|jgi:small subunit ribosomal protein S4|nr:30S ribosomal protein S4 [Candidatus Nitrosotenuis sp.]HIH46564.1 30S ribosomal protein S4 [Candidatus Nitrosotenuis sp.]HIH68481.1 30S ribosomal protein S4 [Candidatus Nitrosotenuis sp.]HII03899.1 30S ribosomal protein S4 [Candidatus Nitrosotenuis sp.]